MSAEYWFARRFPISDARKSLAPVHWKGFAVAGIFVVALVIGAAAFAWMATQGYFAQGLVVFAAAALIGGGWFITVASAKADRTRTVEEYKRTPGV